MHSALTVVHLLVTPTPELAYRLAHFVWVLLNVTIEKGIPIEISYSDVRLLDTFFSDVSFCDNREHVFIFAYDTKKKERQHPLVQFR
jgi:hypothetical protein